MNLGNALATSLAACILAGCTTNSPHPYVVNEAVTNALPPTVDSLVIGTKAGQTGSVFFTSGTLAITNGTIAVGPVGHGELHISGGEVTAREVKLGGRTSTSSGMLHLTDGKLIVLGKPACDACGFSQNDGEIDGGELDVGAAAIVVGEDHDAHLNVRNGTVKAQNLYVGYSPGFTGTMSLSGGTVEVNSNLTIASTSKAARGLMTVSGGTLGVRNGVLAVGPTGRGELDISGGEITAKEVKLGGRTEHAFGLLRLTGGKLNVTGIPDCSACGFSSNDAEIDGGELDASSAAIVIGQDHNAHLNIRNGAAQTPYLYVGYSPGVTGIMSMSGGAIWVSTNFVVGDLVSNAAGNVTLSHGTIFVTNATHNATLEIRKGELTLSGDAALVVDTVIVTNALAHFYREGGTLTCGAIIGKPEKRVR